MSILLVGGTSTDVGKTVATAALAAVAAGAGRTVAVCKPAQTGVAPDEPGDLADVIRLAGVTDTLELAPTQNRSRPTPRPTAADCPCST